MALIDVSMEQYLEAHPDLKFTFFGGKGGVGKTVMAGAAAIGFARQGKKTLLASTNPVHSLSGLLDQDVFGKETPVEGVPNLRAYEIDTRETIERSKVEIKEKIEAVGGQVEVKSRQHAAVDAEEDAVQPVVLFLPHVRLAAKYEEAVVLGDVQRKELRSTSKTDQQ